MQHELEVIDSVADLAVQHRQETRAAYAAVRTINDGRQETYIDLETMASTREAAKRKATEHNQRYTFYSDRLQFRICKVVIIEMEGTTE